MTASETVKSLRAVCPELSGPAFEVATRLGEIIDGEPGGRLILVAPNDIRWTRIRVLVDPHGTVAAAVFELPDTAQVPLTELANALGDAAQDWPTDARRPRFSFEPPDLPCTFEVSVRHTTPHGVWLADEISLWPPAQSETALGCCPRQNNDLL